MHDCAIEKGAFWSPSTTVANLTLHTIYIYIYIYYYVSKEREMKGEREGKKDREKIELVKVISYNLLFGHRDATHRDATHRDATHLMSWVEYPGGAYPTSDLQLKSE